MKILSKSINAESFNSPNENIQLFKLVNQNGMEALITNYGLRLLSLHVPDKNGKLEDVILGYDTLEAYQNKNPFQNAIIGRYANRIANAKFSIDGNEIEVNKNHGAHCLHGGQQGLHEEVWEVKKESAQALHFYHFSPNGSMGFPGNLNIHVYFELTNENEFKIKYEVETDAPTLVNLTYHPYFNLDGSENILAHELQIDAEHILETDKDLIPTGIFKEVVDTPFDFYELKEIGRDIDKDFPAIKNCGGYDHNFILNNSDGDQMFQAANLRSSLNGILMQVHVNQPGLQVYTSNGVNDIGKNGKKIGNHAAICLEPQHFPDSPNHPNFPTTLLMPDEVYEYQCEYRFDVF